MESGAFAADVTLVEGENRLIARATDALGNQGAHTRVVYRDTLAPRLLSSDPGDGALAVDPHASLRVTFSEPLAAVAGGWSLATAAGTALAAVATLDGDTLTLRPAAPLPPQTAIRLALAAAITDRAGNPLADPPTLQFTTADTDAPAVPVLDAIAQNPLCASRLTLGGVPNRRPASPSPAAPRRRRGRAARTGVLPSRSISSPTRSTGSRSPPPTCAATAPRRRSPRWCRTAALRRARLEPRRHGVHRPLQRAGGGFERGGRPRRRGRAGSLAGSVTLSNDGATARFDLAAAPPAGPLP